jgi:hypothetical protein
MGSQEEQMERTGRRHRLISAESRDGQSDWGLDCSGVYEVVDGWMADE